jgi:hypothetical protein
MPNNTSSNTDNFEQLLEADIEAGELDGFGLDDLNDLESLLTESKAIAEANAAGKAYRERLRRGGLAREEVKHIEEKLREWEAKREWETLSNCALFTKQVCDCGHQTDHVFGGMYYRQKHRHMNHTFRYVAATQEIERQTVVVAMAQLPNQVILSEQKVPMCQHCASSKNWDISKGLQGWGGQP